MYSFIDFNLTFIFPLMALLFPFLLISWKIKKQNFHLNISGKRVAIFVGLTLVIAGLIFIGLLYLADGIIFGLFRLEKGTYITDKDITWNVTMHTRVIFVYNPGFGLVAISILIAMMYSAMLSLPKKCISDMSPVSSSTDISHMSMASSASGSIASTISAIGSTAVCCTTSTVSILIPSISIFLGPFVPVLMIISYVLINYSLLKVLLPRFQL